jgi:protein-histidine pros-kinase
MGPHLEGKKPFDLALVLARVEGNTTLLGRMVRIFLEASSQWLADVQGAVQAADPARLQEVAHRLKGSASIFGASAVVEAALRLENMGRDADLTDAAALCGDLEKALGELRMALASLADPPQPPDQPAP